jgi:hypothetical protein
MITDGNTVTNQTLPLMAVTDWQELYGQYGAYDATRYGDRYIAFNQDRNGFLLDFRDSKQALVNLSEIRDVNNVFLDEISGDTMFIEGPSVFQWDPHDTITRSYIWRSKELEFPKPINFGAIQVKYYIPDDLTGEDTAFLLEVQEHNSILMGYVNVCSNNGSAINEYAFRIQKIVESIIENLLIEFVIPTGMTNTGAATLTLGDAPTYPLVEADGTALEASDVVAGSTYQAFFDGASWVLYSENGTLYTESKWNKYHLHTHNQVPLNAHGPTHIHGPNRGPLAGSGIVPLHGIEEITPTLQVTVWARNTYSTRTHIATLEVTDQLPMRLPSGFKSDVWQIEVRGNLHVFSVAIAESPFELRSA